MRLNYYIKKMRNVNTYQTKNIKRADFRLLFAL